MSERQKVPPAFYRAFEGDSLSLADPSATKITRRDAFVDDGESLVYTEGDFDRSKFALGCVLAAAFPTLTVVALIILAH